LLLVFQFQFLLFWFLIFVLDSFVEVLFIFNFIIPSQFTNIIFFNLVLIFLISNFYLWPSCKKIICFEFHHSIQIDDIKFFDLVLIILISNFFLGPFRKKKYYSFQLHHSIINFFMSILILILFIFLNPFAKLIFLFNFTIQSNLKFIWYLNFDPHSFNCYSFNLFAKLIFLFNLIIEYLIDWELGFMFFSHMVFRV